MSRAGFRWIVCGGALAFAGWFCVQEIGAQEPDSAPSDPVAPDAVELVFEREVFSYPSFERRNPFRALTGDDFGPRFEDMVLMGVVLSPLPQTSIAVLGARPAGSGSDQAATRLFRVRSGETLGNVRVIEIRQSEVVFAVEDFGVVETRMLTIQRAGPDPRGSPLQDEPEPPVDGPEGAPADGDDTVGGDTAARLLSPRGSGNGILRKPNQRWSNVNGGWS